MQLNRDGGDGRMSRDLESIAFATRGAGSSHGLGVQGGVEVGGRADSTLSKFSFFLITIARVGLTTRTGRSGRVEQHHLVPTLWRNDLMHAQSRNRRIVVALVCAAAPWLATARPARAQLGGRAGSVRYAARLYNMENYADEPWNAGFGSGPNYSTAPKQVATVNESIGPGPRGSSPSPYRINYGSIRNSEATVPTDYGSGGDPVWNLVRMSDFLDEQQQLTLWITVTSERAMESGQKIQLSSRQITYIQRPDKLAVEMSTDKAQTRIIYDGSGVTVIDKTKNLYGTIPVQGTLESVLDTLAKDYGMAVPADDLLCKGAYDRIKDKILFTNDLGTETIDGRECDHVVFSNYNVDVQMWVESREQPVPRKVVIIYKNRPGRPRCRLDITRFETGPIPPSVFKAEVPAGAQQIRIVPR
jgi:hypothetical protein